MSVRRQLELITTVWDIYEHDGSTCCSGVSLIYPKNMIIWSLFFTVSLLTSESFNNTVENLQVETTFNHKDSQIKHLGGQKNN